jgi:hypothetical protein
MKKVLIFLILFLYGMVSIEGQSSKKEITGRPCAVYNQTRGISEMREILMGDGIYTSNLRIAYALCINRGIGKIIVNGSDKDIEYILENTVLLDVNFVNPSDYENGVRFGDEIKFTNLVGQPSDKWAAFRFNGIDYIYAKVACMNPQRPKIRGIFIDIEKKPEASVSHRVYEESKKEMFQQQSQSVNIYITPPPKEEKKIKIGWIVIPIVAIIAGTATYFLLKNQNHGQDNYRNDYKPRSTKDPIVVPVNPGGPGGTPIPGG